MKKSELKEYIREEIILTLQEEMSPLENAAKQAAIKAAQEKIKDAQSQLQTATTPLEKTAASAALKLAQEKLKQANAIKESESEEEPTEAEIRKEKSLAKAQTEYTKLTKELKSNVGKIKAIVAKKPTERTKTEELLLAKMKELTQRKNQLKTKFSKLEDED